MGWFCNSEEAIEHKKNCKDQFNCGKCIWIDESSNSMAEYGTVVEPDPGEPHPLYEQVMEVFNGREIK